MAGEKWVMLALGVWLAGTLMVSVVATENFYTVDRLLTASSNATFSSMSLRNRGNLRVFRGSSPPSCPRRCAGRIGKISRC
jgi:hypothetical protein